MANVDLKLKIKREFDNFINSLYMMSRTEIISSSYEKVIKEDIVSIIYDDECGIGLENEKILSTLEKPLEFLYQHWLRSERGHMEELRMSILESIKKV